MLATGNRFHYQFPRRFIATNQLDDNINIRVIYECKGVIANLDTVDTRQTGRIIFASGSVSNLYSPAGAPRDFLCIAPQYIESTATDCTQPQ